MTTTTRQHLLRAAERIFAEKGFYGASIANIAGELGLTKQALLHHFGSKEKLYGEVLQAISIRISEDAQTIRDQFDTPQSQLEEMVLAQYRAQLSDHTSARLIMRELLDNEQRAEKAGNWYLKPYLEELVSTIQAASDTPGLSRPRALARVYQFLGAAHYFAVSQPTLTMIFGRKLMKDARACYEDELRALVHATLRQP